MLLAWLVTAGIAVAFQERVMPLCGEYVMLTIFLDTCFFAAMVCQSSPISSTIACWLSPLDPDGRLCAVTR